ncbi:MAG: flavin reductase family protein [Spirochaetia bacterium]|nr:flavin reductase family protein [Spirochaetia bacterium]
MNENEFKDALASLAAGVSVVTYAQDDSFGGLTVTSFTSVSMDPPMILFCMRKGIASDGPIQNSRAFAVNMLSSEQEEVSNGFAGKQDRTALVKETGYKTGETGSPLLDGCIAGLDCRLRDVFDGGDHWIITGEVVSAFSDSKKQPLLYFRRGYRQL